MKKLIQGIVDFRRHVLPNYRLTFARLAESQQPDCLFIACSDSRVVPNLLASTHPGELFMVREVGNLVPAHQAVPVPESSTPAALEFAVGVLGVRDIVVCGHSSCGAMRGLLSPPRAMPHLSAWLQNGANSLDQWRARGPLDASLPDHDQLSQQNVLTQVEHVRSYPLVRKRVAAGRLALHAWWFDIATANVLAYEPEVGKFVLIDEAHAERMLEDGRTRAEG